MAEIPTVVVVGLFGFPVSFPEECSHVCVAMDESGIDLGFDLASLCADDFHIDQRALEEMTYATNPSRDFMYYELKSKTVPTNDR